MLALRQSSALCSFLLLGSLACRSPGDRAAVQKQPAASASVAGRDATRANPAATGSAAAPAALGAPAPDFALPDLEGTVVRLSDFRGKTVVLEWFNPDCPFVRASHTKGSLVGTAERHRAKGVVWLAINSGVPGKQGAGRDTNLEARQRYSLRHPILLDEQGSVGKLYGAKRTPHLYAIDPSGKLVYRGAIDNSPDGEGASPSGGKLVNYVDEALAALAAGKPIATAETEAYGCSVKYAN